MKKRLFQRGITMLFVICLVTGGLPVTASALYDYPCPHYYYNDSVIQKAAFGGNGIERHTCTSCGYTYDTVFPWVLNNPESEYHVSYNVLYHSNVYPKSKYITVKLDNIIKGSVVKVKIGKKTYKKKVKNKRKIKIKIKKRPKIGSKVSIKVYYKGMVIGETYYYQEEDEDYDAGYIYEGNDIVYYAKKIRRGMTKKQVKCLVEWGGPSDTASASGGWSYWYYDDDSYIGFKNGRVRYWYDAAG